MEWEEVHDGKKGGEAKGTKSTKKKNSHPDHLENLTEHQEINKSVRTNVSDVKEKREAIARR